MKIYRKALGATALLGTTLTTPAFAAVTLITSQTAFNAAGTISQNTNFDSNGGGFTYPGDPFSVGALTFVPGVQNIIGGQDDYGLSRALLTDNYFAGTTVQVAGSSNLFGFNAGDFIGSGVSTITVATNLNTYTFTPFVNNGSGPLTFLGFQAGPGENITSVNYYGDAAATGGTDFQIGNLTAGVPEPATWGLMILGFGLVGGAMRRKVRQSEVRFNTKIKQIEAGAIA